MQHHGVTGQTRSLLEILPRLPWRTLSGVTSSCLLECITSSVEVFGYLRDGTLLVSHRDRCKCSRTAVNAAPQGKRTENRSFQDVRLTLKVLAAFSYRGVAVALQEAWRPLCQLYALESSLFA